MSYEEKGVWVYLVVSVATFAVYVGLVMSRAAGGPLTDVAYAPTLLWSIGIAVAASVIGRVMVEIARPSESYERDVRDKEIDRFGEYVGHWPLIAAALAALLMALAAWDHFWIANVLYLGFVLSAVVGSVVKLVAYRQGVW